MSILNIAKILNENIRFCTQNPFTICCDLLPFRHWPPIARQIGRLRNSTAAQTIGPHWGVAGASALCHWPTEAGARRDRIGLRKVKII